MLAVSLIFSLVLATPDVDPSDAGALMYPSPIPVSTMTCTYEGMVPGSTAQGRWTETMHPGGKRTIDFASPEQWTGIAATRLAGKTFTVQSHSHQGLAQQRGPQRVVHDTFRFEVTADGATEPTELTVSVRVDSTCAGFPRVVKPGDTWSCEDRITDTWSTKGGLLPADSGTTRLTVKSSITYREVTTLDVPAIGKIRAAVLDISDEDGGQQRIWLDPEFPTCPLKTDRIKVEHVVGTDRLVERVTSAPKRKAAPIPTGTVKIGGWALGMLVGLCLVVLIAMAIVWYAGRRNA